MKKFEKTDINEINKAVEIMKEIKEK